jgi:hypothetical protein
MNAPEKMGVPTQENDSTKEIAIPPVETNPPMAIVILKEMVNPPKEKAIPHGECL